MLGCPPEARLFRNRRRQPPSEAEVFIASMREDYGVQLTLRKVRWPSLCEGDAGGGPVQLVPRCRVSLVLLVPH